MNSHRTSLPRWNEITAVFGGRFDPPHLGHREAVRGLFQYPGVRKVLIIPSASPPHKPTIATAKQRAEMAELNFQSIPSDSFPQEVQIDHRELDRARLQPGLPSYSFDTLQELQPLFNKQLAFVIGTDQLEQLPTWHRFPDLLSLSHWIVLLRKPEGESKALRILQEWQTSGLLGGVQQSQTWPIQRPGGRFLMLVSTNAPAISSTQIREKLVKSGSPPKGAIFEKVFTYLKDNRLYGI